jgi:hypothetical protein
MEFEEPQPARIALRKLGLLGRLFRSRRETIERDNAERVAEHERVVAAWESAKSSFEASESERKVLIERGIYTDTKAMEAFLEMVLLDIVWPRETTVSAEVNDAGKQVFIDVDLPEIEDMPTKTASAPQRGYKLTVKEMTPSRVQQLYMRHIHGIGLRIIGETFATLPVAQTVVLSAFSQRPDPKTGHLNDEYLYSVRVGREEWSGLNFENLESLDAVEALAQFELRREVTKMSGLKPIEPFAPDA